NGEVFTRDVFVYFTPGQRRRDAGIVAGPGAVGGGERFPLDILQVIDIHASTTGANAPLDRCELWMLLRDHRRDDLTEDQPGLVRRPRGQRDVDVQSVGA